MRHSSDLCADPFKGLRPTEKLTESDENCKNARKKRGIHIHLNFRTFLLSSLFVKFKRIDWRTIHALTGLRMRARVE